MRDASTILSKFPPKDSRGPWEGFKWSCDLSLASVQPSPPQTRQVHRYWRIKERKHRKWQSGRKRKCKSVLNVQSLKVQNLKKCRNPSDVQLSFYILNCKTQPVITELPCQALSMYEAIKTSMVEVCLCQLPMVGTVILTLYRGVWNSEQLKIQVSDDATIKCLWQESPPALFVVPKHKLLPLVTINILYPLIVLNTKGLDAYHYISVNISWLD